VKILSWDEFVGAPFEDRPLAATVGVFDGLHRGHVALVDRVLTSAGTHAAVFTFRENPKRSLRPRAYHGDLFSLEQKLETLERLGVEICVLIDFSGDFSKLAGRIFLSFLAERGGLRLIVLGSDFRCGHRLDTGVAEIRAYYAPLGIRTEVLEPVLWGGHPISSSRIRKAVVEGRIDEASAMLGRPYELDLRRAECVAPGCLRLELDGLQVFPPSGRYDSIVVGDGWELRAQASCAGGIWTVEVPDGSRPEALRLVELVSRE